MVQVQIEAENPFFEFCEKPLECSHACKGVKGESRCLPCLRPECIQTAIEKSKQLPVLASRNSSAALSSSISPPKT